MGWKCKKCGFTRIEADVCASSWIKVEVNTKDKDAEFDTSYVELDEVCWDDQNQTIDGYSCCKCGNNSTSLEEIAEWTD